MTASDDKHFFGAMRTSHYMFPVTTRKFSCEQVGMAAIDARPGNVRLSLFQFLNFRELTIRDTGSLINREARLS